MLNRYASLRQGLVGCWVPSLGASGFRLIDRSGYGNHGTLTNMDPGTDWVPSGGKLALDFDGVDDLASATTKIQAGSLSISAWVFIRTLDSTTRYIAAVQNSGLDGGRMLRINSANQIQFEIIGSAIKDANGAALSTGRWIHVAGIKDAGSTGYVYQDGIQSGSVALSGVTYTAELSNFTLGRRPDSTANFLNGQLDDIRIYNRALTPSEISLLYTGGRGVGLMPERIKHRRKISAAATNRRRRIICGASS